ncbi:coiled-coil domain-containing protein 170 isoform X1 [Micropterus dolomieu]|uniref:coiled-coil domain-containing protein 170 isoform X1 n=2 Tax=Micropterus dolomieu TaxID=147949 RepID=UPI001E8D8B2D|nr:coiled-coil domain-containing protein 170 isoform X1 [Micropterus dolomieu]XP_045918941.1 coiled-coil domain-containing protein 170 isoform X1 [Micropterus dolomieu]
MEVMESSDEVDQSHERERLKMRIAVLEESMKSCEIECKASRETVLRLVAELDRERRKAAGSAAALDSLKVELDGLLMGRRSVEAEKETLVERLGASKRVIEATRRESHCLEKQVEELERKLQSSKGETQAAEEKLQMFLKKVAGLLQGKSENVVLPTEKDILHKVDNLCNKSLSEMEARLCHVSEELSEQMELQNSVLQRAQLAEQQVQDLRERLQGLETELLKADMHCDGLRHSKQHYEEFLEKLSGTMKVDSIAVDLGFDMRLKLILSRVEQLVKQEATALVESKSLTYSLQRKLKSQKDQLESKGLHIQLLRKKVSELEEEKRRRSVLAVERDDAHLETRRLQKKLERLQGELKATKMSNTELKAQLSHTNELKLKVMEHSQTMQEQKKRLDQLVEGKAKVEKKLNTVSLDLQSQETKTREDQQQLNTLRQSLAQLSERERELVNFRMVVSQMLGLDATDLALPNHEIIKLLETFLHTHHHHHHLHHVNMPWHCPTHQRPHLPQVHELPDSSLGVSTSRSAYLGDAVPLHEA